MTDRTLITPESGAIPIEGCSIFNHPRIRGRYRSSHLCRRIPGRYLYLSWTAGYLERHETPWNASGIASPRFGHLSQFGTSNSSANLQSYGVTSRSRHAASRSVTHGLGSVQALPWSCLITEGGGTVTLPITNAPLWCGLWLTEGSLKVQGMCARITHRKPTGLCLGYRTDRTFKARIVHASLHHREDQ